MRTILNLMLATALAAGATLTTGCFVGDQPEYAAGNGAYDDGSPDLVEVSPGVQVIADYDEPIFFNDGFYWRNNGGVWYSSRTWGGGWGRNYNPPVGIARIDRPGNYAHYRPAGWTPRANRAVAGRGDVRQPTRVERPAQQARPAPAAASHSAPRAFKKK